MKYFAKSEFTKTDFIKCRRFDKTKSKFLNLQFDFQDSAPRTRSFHQAAQTWKRWTISVKGKHFYWLLQSQRLVCFLTIFLKSCLS